MKSLLEFLAAVGIRRKMRFIVFLGFVLFPLSLLVFKDQFTPHELTNVLAGWFGMSVVLLVPMAALFSEVLVLRNIRELNGLCAQMKEGDLTPFEYLPREPEEGDELQKLKHGLFWVGHVVDSRQKALSAVLDQLKDAQEQMVESIEYASLIQHAFLPREEEFAEVFREHFLLWEQRDRVGGDAHWLKRTRRGFFAAVIDCTGHGVPGAFMTLIVHSLFERMNVNAFEGDPAGLLAAMNVAVKKALARDGGAALCDDGMDCALVHVDPVAGRIVFAGARNSLFVSRAEGEVEEIRGDRCGIGYIRSPEDYRFTNREIVPEDGMRIYALTDGLLDQVGGPKGFPYGKSRFRSFLKAHRHLSLGELREALRRNFEDYKGRETRRDDVTVLGFAL